MSFSVPSVAVGEWLPLSLPLLAAFAVLMIDCFAPKRCGWVFGVSVAGLLATGAALVCGWLPPSGRFFLDMLVNDRMAVLGGLLVLFAALAVLLVSRPMIEGRRIASGEYAGLLLFAVFGMVLLAMSQELLTIFLCIEILSLCLYVMAGIDRRDPRALEAGFKYFVLGSVAGAFFVFGTAFLFGATGTTHLHLIAERVARGYRPAMGGGIEEVNALYVFIGAVMIAAGLAFKLSLAPFHMWAPDVYEGAPAPVTLFIATASKVAGFIAAVRIFEALAPWAMFREALGPVLWSLAAVSAVWGNLAALVQRDLKRMLAYSSVAHGGYMMVAVAALAWANDAVQVAAIRQAILVYLLAYVLMNVVAFGVIAAIGPDAEIPMERWRGLARKRGGLAAAMALAMVSLTGIPPTVGFAGKLYVFQSAIDTGLIGLAIVAVLASVVSAFYYLRVVVLMYMEESEGEVPKGLLARISGGGAFALGLTSALVFLFGLAPMIFLVL